MAEAEGRIFIGLGETPRYLDLRLANRHGLVAGATGTGKTVTLQVLAEGFSGAGVPVFCADIKGDLSGIAMAGTAKPAFVERAGEVGLGADWAPKACPTLFWDIFGENGHPIRATISDMGPLLLARLMDLNETQEGVLNIVFRVADDEGLLLLDLKDLRALLDHLTGAGAILAAHYGHVAKASVGAIMRRLLVLESQGGAFFFGEPALDVGDLMQVTRDGRGVVNVLDATRLMGSPRLYGTVLLWLLAELYETLPEVGDVDKPRLVFFFDEAHLLFDEAPKALLEKIEQVARLIRSKGVGVYFVTQNPLDVPDSVLSQLGNRVQHALHAFTPRDQKAVRAVAETFRPNPRLDIARMIGELGLGEALVSCLEARAVPAVVERTLICPPAGRVGPLTPAERQAVIAASPLVGHYDAPVDRESAYELLTDRATQPVATDGSWPDSRGDQKPSRQSPGPGEGGFGETLGGVFGTNRSRGRRLTTGQHIARSVTRTLAGRAAGEIGRDLGGSLGGSIGRAIMRGVLGSLLRR